MGIFKEKQMTRPVLYALALLYKSNIIEHRPITETQLREQLGVDRRVFDGVALRLEQMGVRKTYYDHVGKIVDGLELTNMILADAKNAYGVYFGK